MISLRWALPALLLLALALATPLLQGQSGGRTLAFALWTGAVLGLVLQRTRFCFYCHARDWFEQRDPRGLLAIVLALAVGLVGYTVVLGGWLPVPTPGRLPPDIHIGPVSSVLVAAGLAFGAGMAVSGSCISAHWYRLAEGSPVAPFALLGTAAGFGLGFLSWNPLYSLAVADAPVVWLPAHLGYGGALLLQLGVLAACAAWLWRGFRGAAARAGAAPPPLGEAWQRLWQGRWPYWSGGLLVGAIGVLTVLRMRPLGVTTTLGSATRSALAQQGWVPQRLEGLDGFAGCATLPGAEWLTPHAVLLAGLLAGALAAALASGQWAPRRPTGRDAARGLAGGVLLGWGAMTGLGCSIGTLLSGTMAGALSGWVFGVAVFAALAAAFALRRRLGGGRAA
ncbi:YeeE/YedE family protein [Xylophilus sp. GW821-FHT01B05]